jgi:two-component system nitrate/nitrite response regulator NarL
MQDFWKIATISFRMEVNKWGRVGFRILGRQAEDGPMRCINVVIADRHPVVLHGLSNLLGAHHDFSIVACCSDGTSCIGALRKFAPDIVVLDVSMSGMTWLEILSIVNSENISTRLVFFIGSEADFELVTSAAADAYSIVPKDAAPKILVQSLRQIAEGRRLLLSPSSERAVSREQNAIAENALSTLTDRERQIMRLVSEGLSNKEIGRRLNIADGTIKVHLHHIFQKLEISNRTVLAALAISQNDRAGPPEDKTGLPTCSD